MYQFIKPISILIVLIAIGSAVFLGYNPRFLKSNSHERLVVSSSNFALSGLLFLAQQQQLFQKQGLEVVINNVPSGKQAIENLFVEKAQLALSTETPIMLFIMQGKKLIVLGALGESVGDNALVGRVDHGITTPDDLAGKSIAVELGTSGEYFLDTLLSSHHIDRSQVIIVPTSSDQIAPLLLSGKVDAGSSWPPYVLPWQKQLGKNAVTFNNPHYLAMAWCVVSTPEYVSTHPKTLKKFFRALAEAEQHWQENPEELRKVLIEKSQINRELLDLNIYRFGLRFDQSIAVNLEGLSKWAIQRGMVAQQTIPNYLNFFETEPLSAVKPDAVTIVH
jgi:NitT/TauT family transport system substrate-binding protein